MIVIIVGLLVCVSLALVVVALVALPARREGRDVLTPRGEDLVDRLRPGSSPSAPETDVPAVAATPHAPARH